MGLRNSPTTYGLVSKLLHWSIALNIFTLLGLGLYIKNTKITYDMIYLFGWHKSLGLLTFTLILLRVIWLFASSPPDPLGADGWQKKAAHLAHRSFYLLIVAMPVSGWIASSASGLPMDFLGLFPIPAIAPENEQLETVMFAVHGVVSKLLIFLLIVHIGAAFQRQFVKRDGTLRRIWFW